MQIIAGPCSFETYEDTLATVDFMTKLGITMIRGGALKYRSNPADYQGQKEVYQWIEKLKETYAFKFVNEIYEPIMAEDPLIDVIQIGSRNMHNTNLLKQINGMAPIILKRHYAASLNEFLNHAEYLDESEVILCLRGTMGLWPQEQRFLPDITDIPRLRKMIEERGKNYKICYDVSHSACHKDYVEKLALVALLYNPDYIMCETHPAPYRALSDAQQQLGFKEFLALYNKLKNYEKFYAQ